MIPPQAHSLGLQLGIYEDLGNFTCMGYPGTTLDKVVQDAQTFAEWKVDMLKLDGCFSTPKERAKGASHSWLGAVGSTGRDGYGGPTSAHWLSLSVCMAPRKSRFPGPGGSWLPDSLRMA